MFIEAQAKLNMKRVGNPWRPANGTEGDIFISNVCRACVRDAADCDIILRVYAFKIGDPSYPVEWVIGGDGQPQCTAYNPPQTEADRKYLEWKDTSGKAEGGG